MKKGTKKYRLYHVWVNMKRRCYDKRCSAYKYYGARGITICLEWLDFDTFFEWALRDYKFGLQIDRINNDGNYCPKNCRWVTSRQNANNRSNTIFIIVEGEKHSIADWSRKFNINLVTVKHRLDKGMAADEAFKLKVANNYKGLLISINNKVHSLSEWCRIYNGKLTTVWRRIQNGMTPEEALKTKKITLGETLTINGETHTLYEWSKIYNLKYDTVWHRINRFGMTPEEALNYPLKEKKLIEINGEKHTAYEWSKIYGIKYPIVWRRIKKGMSVETALLKDIKHG
jgi:hypothetical protein